MTRQPSPEPRTAAGRDLRTNAHWDDEEERLLLPGYIGVDDLTNDILAIEAEAAAGSGSLDVASWTFRDPDGSGFCTRCLLPIAVHPLDEHGDDVDRCPDQPARLLRERER